MAAMMTEEDKAKVFDVHDGGALGNLAEWLGLPLEHAAAIGDVEHMRKLLKHGAPANAVCSASGSILHLVATASHHRVIPVLVNGGAIVDAVDAKGETALHLAALNNYPRTVTALLAAGASVDFPHSAHGTTALHTAAYEGNVAVVAALLQGAASLDAVKSDGHTALHTAAFGDQVGVINAIVRGGADVNAEDNGMMTPLHIAAEWDLPDSVTALCELGADVDRPDTHGSAPLHIAAEPPGNPCAAQALVAARANVDLRRSLYESSALDMAVCNNLEGVIRTLIQCGANVNSADSEGWTALHHAAGSAHSIEPCAIDLLVEAGADLDAPDSRGQTPLHHASEFNEVEAARALLDHGASVNASDNNKQLPLHLATLESHENSSAEMVETLLGGGADESAVDKNGLTAAELVWDASSNPLVLDLLANARAQRVWRRRRFFVMCRAYPGRAKPKHPQPISPGRDGVFSNACGIVTRNRASLARVGGSRDDAAGNVGGRVTAHRGATECAGLADGLESLVAGVVGMGENALFRNVIEFL